MRQHRYPRQTQQPQQAALAPPQNSASTDVQELGKIIQGTQRTNTVYPAQYEQQEAQILEQVIARRKAFMDRYGSAEQQYAQQGFKPTARNAIAEAKEKDMITDLFQGDA